MDALQVISPYLMALFQFSKKKFLKFAISNWVRTLLVFCWLFSAPYASPQGKTWFTHPRDKRYTRSFEKDLHAGSHCLNASRFRYQITDEYNGAKTNIKSVTYYAKDDFTQKFEKAGQIAIGQYIVATRLKSFQNQLFYGFEMTVDGKKKILYVPGYYLKKIPKN